MDNSTHQTHRRRSSHDDSEIPTARSSDPAMSNRLTHVPAFSLSPPRQRVTSNPGAPEPPLSAGPHRTTFNGLNGPRTPPYNFMQSSGGHSRTRSISTPYSPPLPSPLSFSFPREGPKSPSLPTSVSAPIARQTSPEAHAPAAQPNAHSRRHSRLHSRNLSVFFPRPGTIPSTAIAEDGSQEISIPAHVDSLIPPGPNINIEHKPNTPLGAGFTFGTRPPATNGMTNDPPVPPLMGKTTRRGHHHKHSVSHNFFSFLEPGSDISPQEHLLTQPTPSPVSQWSPSPVAPTSSHSQTEDRVGDDEEEAMPTGLVSLTFIEFILGGWLWVCGQQIGSLSVTGLGYWVVFDVLGMAMGSILPSWLGPGNSKRERSKRPYGNARVETLFMFAKAVYLLFAAVYVCKETVEHVLMSAGGGDGHHHHHGDDETPYGIDFPIVSILLALGSILGSGLFFQNHAKLLDVTGNRLPSPGAFIRSITSASPSHIHDLPPTEPLAMALSNPYVISPLVFGAAILGIAAFIPSSQQTSADLTVATIIAAVTFNVAYSASYVLGTVLLQTSPPRGTAAGRMESFLRAMREVERHPQVLHLPAPHIWQLTPTTVAEKAGQSQFGRVWGEKGQGTMIVTMELHVRGDLGDDEVLKLTRWAHERASGALGGEREVTVGVVRG